jgi:hypothetical protein
MFDDAAYLRGQALLRLNMARQMSDPAAAERLRSEALAYTLRAEGIEDRQQQGRKEEAVRHWKNGQ